ncbi:MAG TPA: DUF892 family protein [Flavisolibacter sp.]|jgi:ferritin-like metal-binding protein YciE|nr:DUF892 family protein [Flavisolibacter sp.]
MEKMNDLNDLLKHEIQDLYSAEEQILAALPVMIEKASDQELKTALQQHLDVTARQKNRLDQLMGWLNAGQETTEKKGLLSRLFKSKQVCRGMQGLIEEGTKVMNEDMDKEVLDAAIIACAQKIEHYEICGYGTARTYARELGQEETARLLEETLAEEYEADDLLTRLATRRINLEAQSGPAKGRKAQAPAQAEASQPGRTASVRQSEPELEMASAPAKSGGTKKAATVSKGNPAPKGSAAPRSNSAAGRTTPLKRTAASKSETPSARTGVSSGSTRGGTTPRGKGNR